MGDTTGNEIAQDASELAAAVRDRGIEQLEGAKGQIAEGAERVAAAVERTADELDGDGDGALSGFGHSVASLMRQLAGGLRERAVDEFARELGALARRNPGVFLAGSVAVGFGIARFFKARAPLSASRGDVGWQDGGSFQRSAQPFGVRKDFDGDESVDLSAARRGGEEYRPAPSGNEPQGSGTSSAAQRDEDRGAAEERTPSKPRQPGKQSKAKPTTAVPGTSTSSNREGAPRGDKS